MSKFKYDYNNDPETHVQLAPDLNKVGVTCRCGNILFTLHYGEYKIVAKCSKCGAFETVYDG